MILVAFIFCASLDADAGWMEELNTKAEAELKPLVLDIGRIINSGLFKNMAAMEFPAAEAAIDCSFISVDGDNDILSSGLAYLPYASFRIAVPNSLTLFGRVMDIPVSDSAEGILFLGCGASYALAEDRTVPFSPAVTAFTSFNTAKADGFLVNSLVTGLIISKQLPIISPYIGVSYDMTASRIETAVKAFKPSSNEVRYGGGFKLKLIRFLFLNAEASNIGYSAGLGFKIGIPG